MGHQWRQRPPRQREPTLFRVCIRVNLRQHTPRCAEHLQSIRLVFARLFQGRTEHSLCLRPGVRGGGAKHTLSYRAQNVGTSREQRRRVLLRRRFAHATQVAGCYVSHLDRYVVATQGLRRLPSRCSGAMGTPRWRVAGSNAGVMLGVASLYA